MTFLKHFRGLTPLLLGKSDRVLAINQRNLGYIYPNNQRKDYPLADDKLLAKEVLVPAGVPMPKTYLVYSSFYELKNMEEDLLPFQDFVIKPAMGRAGGGVVVVTEKAGPGRWRGVKDNFFTLEDLRRRFSDILFGTFSFGLSDRVIVEERLIQHPQVANLSYQGLADVRIILLKDRPVMAMTRLPTRFSEGRANLHQGALGVGVDLKTGVTTHAVFNGEPITRHPDTGENLIGIQLPDWDEVCACAVRAAKAVPLKYLGVDLALTHSGVKLIEINVRPGLEIQNANLMGLKEALEPKAEKGGE